MEFKKEEKEELEFNLDSISKSQSTWFLGRFLYFNKTLKVSLIALNRVKRQLDRILGFFSWLIFFAGYFAFFFWIYLNFEAISQNPDKLIFFWTDPDIIITFFLLTLWIDLYLIYKYSRRKSDKKKINYRFFKKDKKNKVRYNVARTLDNEAQNILEDAYLLARKTGTSILPLHFFRVSLKNEKMQNLLIRLNVDASRLVAMCERAIIRQEAEGGGHKRSLSEAMEQVLISAFVRAYQDKQEAVDVLSIMIFCVEQDEALKEILYDLEVDSDKVSNTVAWFRMDKKLRQMYDNYRKLSILKPGSSMNRSYTAIATPTLDRYSIDLTLKAKAGAFDLCVGRDKEISSIYENFVGGHGGVILVGPEGAGKSTIIGGLAQNMVEEDVPRFLKDKRLVEIDVSRLLSGADAGTAQERLLSSLSEARRSGNIVLYIDNIENLIGISSGGDESLDVSEVLSEAISRGQILCLASATLANYSRYIEERSIGNAMTSVYVKEPNENQAIQVLESKVGFLESKYDVYIVYSALEQAVRMSEKYLKDKALPLKAINLLEKSAMLAAKRGVNNPEKVFCSAQDVALAIEEMTGIPSGRVDEDESGLLLNLESNIHKRLIGQDEAVKAVSASLRRSRASLRNDKKPIASFLFLGPTGVGKTELAKAVSQIYFGSEDYMIRLDMSEYQHPDSVNKMIGDIDGNTGYLTEAVRKKPFSLILLDEIEKADTNILNLFLQLLDDGRLTDGQGRTISFSESIIIATSNIGAKFIQDSIKQKQDLGSIRRELVDNYLREKMRPELINRFDGIIVFKPLSENDVFKIATLMLKGIKANLEEKGIELKADKDGVMKLAHAGYDPKFGARPMRRLLQEKVEDVIANKILAKELSRRDRVLIDSNAKILIEKAKDL